MDKRTPGRPVNLARLVHRRTARLEFVVTAAGEVSSQSPEARLGAQTLLARRATGRLVLAMLVAATCLYIFRRPTSIALPVFFAEDGSVFFKDALARGWPSILDPYAGQVLAFQRAAAWGLSKLPVLIQPAAYVAVAVAVAVTSCSIVLSARWRTSAPIVARFACLIALLCSPAVDETFATLSNTHWWLGIGLLLLGMLHDPLNRRIKVGEMTFVAVAALSGFAVIYGLPSLAVRAIRERSRHSVALVSIAVVGLLLQIASVASSGRRGDLGAILSDPVRAFVVLIKRVFAASALGDSNLMNGWLGYQADWWVWLVTLTLIAAFLVVWSRSPSLESAALLLTLLGGWILALYAMSQPGSSIDLLVMWPTAASRFFLAPVAVLFVTLIVAPQRTVMARVGSGVACLLLAVGILSDYRLIPLQKVDWEPFARCVEQAVTTCSTTIAPDWPLQIEPAGQ
jgi:hypothetical protein